MTPTALGFQCPSRVVSAAEADWTLGGGVFGELRFSLAPVGDVDADGRADFAFNAQYDDDIGGAVGLGRVFVISGATHEIILAVTGETEGIQMGGEGLSPGGDIDRDGFDDIVAGTNARLVVTLSGRTGAVLRTYEVPNLSEVWPCRVDVDHDGVVDQLISTFSPDDVQVLSGATGDPLHWFEGSNSFGDAVASADVDADSYPDIIVGAPDHLSDKGVVYVYSGATGELLHQIDGEESDAELGAAVAGVGDINQDGHDDFAAAADRSDAGGPDSGAVMFFSGLDGALLRTVVGLKSDQYAQQIIGLGDITADGVPEYALGVEDADHVEIYSGRTGALLRTYVAADVDDRFPSQVTAVDVSGDGLLDLVVVAIDAGENEEGLVYVFETPAGGLSEPVDLDQDGLVGTGDLLLLLGAWGTRDPCADLDASGLVDGNDLLILLGAWGL